MKSVNRQLTREKIYHHVEQYLAEYIPGITFEQFLLQTLFPKREDEARKRTSYRIDTLRPDFQSFLNAHCDSLYAVFDFYLCEYQNQVPQPLIYRYSTLQPDVRQTCMTLCKATYLFLQDMDAFNPDSGLSKGSFKRILAQMQKPYTDEQ